MSIKDDEITIKDLINIVKKWYVYLLLKWKIIVLCGLFGAGLGLSYSLLKKISYKATLSFALEDEKGGGGIGSALGLASSLGLDLGGSGGGIFSASNLTTLFKSRAMVEKTLLSSVIDNGKEISLAELLIRNNNWRENWNKNPKFRNIQFPPNSNRKLFTRAQDSILKVMYESFARGALEVAQKDKKISIVTIEVTTKDELFSQYFCEGLVEQVSNFYIDTRSKKARLNMNILERQTDSIRTELNSSITGVAVANDNTFNLNPALNIRRVPSSRKQVDVQANSVILGELVKQTELAKVTLRRETPLIQVIDRPILPLENDRISKIKGIILGGFLFGFISVLGLIIKKTLSDLNNN